MPEDVRLKWIADRISSFNETFDISWKVDQNNPIYKFYEKEVGRYLKNKYDAKLVTDDKGVSWYQVDVKDSMGWPVEAFRAGKNITQNLSPEQVKEVQALNKKLFGDDKVKITESILSNHEALGSYKDGMIKIVNGQANPKDTYLHEAVHKYLDVFMNESEHTDILKYASEKYGIDDFVAVEEKLAEDFIKYTKDRAGFTGKMKTYFESFLSRIKAYFGNADKIDTLYRDISGGKAKVQKPKTAMEKFRSQDSGINNDFDLSKYFSKKQFMWGTRKDYLERKYKWIAKDTGLDSLWISDKSIEWIDNWSNAEVITPDSEIISELWKFKPNKVQDIYWGWSADDFSLSRSKPQSFTSDIYVAKEFWSAWRRDNPIIVRVKGIEPEDVAIDLWTLPEWMKKVLRIYDEKEVITKSAMDSLSKKYTISTSKDLGKTWTPLNENTPKSAKERLLASRKG